VISASLLHIPRLKNDKSLSDRVHLPRNRKHNPIDSTLDLRCFLEQSLLSTLEIRAWNHWKIQSVRPNLHECAKAERQKGEAEQKRDTTLLSATLDKRDKSYFGQVGRLRPTLDKRVSTLQRRLSSFEIRVHP
jgi:hypothetical protein